MYKILKSRFNLYAISSCLISILLTSNVVLAEGKKQTENDFRSPKKKERIDMIKKMKLLEVLDLDESKSEKFIVKLNTHEKKISENRDKHHNARVKLEEAIKTNNANDIKALSNQLVDLQDDFNKSCSDKVKDMRTVLSEVEFAKFVCFENSFMRDFFDSCMDGKYKKNKATTRKAKTNKKRKRANG